MSTDYVYKNADDTKRFKIFKVEYEEFYVQKFHWDVDVWDSPDDFWTYGPEATDVFDRKADAKEWIEEKYGPVKSIRVDKVTEGWEEK